NHRLLLIFTHTASAHDVASPHKVIIGSRRDLIWVVRNLQSIKQLLGELDCAAKPCLFIFADGIPHPRSRDAKLVAMLREGHPVIWFGQLFQFKTNPALTGKSIV